MMPTYDRAILRVAGDAYNRILRVNQDRLNESLELHRDTMSLFHYTTSDGLRGIVEDNCLHASAAYFLNDFSEIEYGCGILDEVLADWQESHRSSLNPLCTRLVREMRNSFSSDVSKLKRSRSLYVACFCQTDNLLSQWRAYGQTGGYSIGFTVSATRINADFLPEPNAYTDELIQVDYNRDKQVAKCSLLLEALQPILDDVNLEHAMLELGSHPLFGFSQIRDVIEELFLNLIVGFKHEAFQEEQEWRIVVCPRKLRKQGTDDGGRTKARLHFRSLKGALVPYVRLAPAKGKLPIRSVRCGPSLDLKRGGISVEMLLEAQGFQDIPVSGSNIPVRL
jgi:hypothetical protein